MNRSIFVHPKAIIETGATLGQSSRVWAFAHVMSGVTIGKDCNIGNYVFIESGVSLGDQVNVKNGVQIWEGVTAEDRVFIGPNCVFTNDLIPRSFMKRPKREWLKKTRLKEGCTLGANATILCGVDIGRFAFLYIFSRRKKILNVSYNII